MTVPYNVPGCHLVTKNKEAVFEVFTADLVSEINAVPVDYQNGVLDLWCTDANDIYLQQRAEILSGVCVRLIEKALRDIEASLTRYKDKYDQLRGLSEDFRLEIVVERGEIETTKQLLDDEDDEGPIVRLINTIILTALKKRVSDIHIECNEYSIAVKYRIDGVLYPATEDLDISHHSALVSRLKVMAELDIAEKRTPQDGRFKLRLGRRDIDFRLSVIPSFFGENVVVRVLDNYLSGSDVTRIDLTNMGFTQNQLIVFSKAINEPHGMVLVTGPTGSGKTTTLYSALNTINSGKQKIITIEDPIEYHLDGIMQIPVNTKKGLTFAKGLRSILRHDPDKILVGEIRDGETADIAIQSALTGHLVFSTVHANNAFDVMGRLQNIGVNLHSCMSALNCVVSQRLVRLNCKHCLIEDTIDRETLMRCGFHREPGSVLYRGQGCERCDHTGFSGRTMICEILSITDELRKSVLDGAPISELVEKIGLVDNTNLRDSAKKLVYAGRSTVEEINRVTFNQ